MLKETLSIREIRPIPGFSRYMITEDGAIYSKVRKRFMPLHKNWNGYLTATLIDDGGYRAPRKVHRLVYLTYIGPFEDGKIIDHRDDDMYNCHYSNLQQITPAENSRKSFITGINRDKVVWDKTTIHKICKMIQMNWTNRQIFTAIGIDYDSDKDTCNHLIGSLINGRNAHKEISSQYDFSGYVATPLNQKDVKLSIPEVRLIYMDLLNGVSPTTLSKKFNVTHSTICKIRDKKTWRAVTSEVDVEVERSTATLKQPEMAIEVGPKRVGENPLNRNMDDLSLVTVNNMV